MQHRVIAGHLHLYHILSQVIFTKDLDFFPSFIRWSQGTSHKAFLRCELIENMDATEGGDIRIWWSPVYETYLCFWIFSVLIAYVSFTSYDGLLLCKLTIWLDNLRIQFQLHTPDVPWSNAQSLPGPCSIPGMAFQTAGGFLQHDAGLASGSWSSELPCPTPWSWLPNLLPRT